MQRINLIAGFVLLLTSCGLSMAADVTATSQISSVEVYPSGATVSRSADVSVKQGDSVIVVPHLPIGLDPDSVRVEGQSTAGLEIVSVDVRRVDPKPFDRPTEIDLKIKKLQKAYKAVQDRIATANEQMRFINNLVAEAPKQLYSRKAEQPVPDWFEMLKNFGTSLAHLRETIRTANERAASIAEEIARLKDEQNRTWPEDRPTMEARINVAAAADGTASLIVRYSTADAFWRPIYDARLTLGDDKPALELVRRAVVRQSSGEDWVDTELTLSTAKPGGRAAAPRLRPLILRIAPPPRPVAQKRMRMAPGRAEMEIAAAPQMDAAAEAPARMPAAERVAQMETRGFDLVYKIPGRATVAGDGRDKKLKIGIDAISPKLIVRSVPVLDQTAYLTVKFANKTAGPILPGTVQLFRDGVFVGKSRIAFVAPKEDVEFGFGEDPAVVVERVTLVRSEGESGILSTDKTDERRFRISVINRHKQAMRIEIEDRLPRSENEKITVEPLSSMTKPTRTDPDGRRGILVWDHRYKPNEKREILLGFTVSWPEGEMVMWGNVR